jgi:hypothetical protein
MKAYWVIGIVMATGLRAQSPDCAVNVYVRTGLAMPFGMLVYAKPKVTQMFREIGVNVRMRTGRPTRDSGDACGGPIVVQLEVASRYPVPTDALAYALPYKDSGTCIHVFLERVLRVGGDRGLANALLAHVMVHEITHVLEQIDRHSAEGVMKAVWSDHDYENMKRHPLSFAPEDVYLIHKGLAKRIARATAD